MTQATEPGRRSPASYGYAPSVFTAVSYGGRLVDGPGFSIDDALGRSAPAPCVGLAA